MNHTGWLVITLIGAAVAIGLLSAALVSQQTDADARYAALQQRYADLEASSMRIESKAAAEERSALAHEAQIHQATRDEIEVYYKHQLEARDRREQEMAWELRQARVMIVAFRRDESPSLF